MILIQYFIPSIMREGDDYDQADRWKSLYQKGVAKQVRRKEIEERAKEEKEIEELRSHPFTPEIHYYESTFEGERPREKRIRELASIRYQEYFDKKEIKEIEECTFKPRLIAEEKLRENNMTTTDLSQHPENYINSQSLESYYKRMQEAHYRRKEMEDYEDNFCGSGKNWENKLTLPTIPDFHEKFADTKRPESLEQVRCITKPVVRNGEVVKDPFIQISRHDTYKKSSLTSKLREEQEAGFNDIRNKNERIREPLFEENVDFED